MWTDTVHVVDDVAAAGWLAGRLSGRLGTVTGTVPDGYPAYARILHPVEFYDGQTAPMTWAEVAAVTGRQMHPTVQWHRLIGADDPYDHWSDVWRDGKPEVGNLALPALQALCDALADHTSTPDDCWFAMWEGWGQLSGGRARVLLTTDGPAPEEMPPLLDPRERAAPRVHLPGRDHLLMRGPLSAMAALVRYDGPDQVRSTQSPALFWPADRAWCVATEIDFDSTLVAGPAALVEAVLAAPTLEAWRVDATDSLQSDADSVNA